MLLTLVIGSMPAVTWPGTPPVCNTAYMIVWGVVSPAGTYGLIKNLQAIPGVAGVHFDLMHGLATIHLRPGAQVSDDQLRTAARSASYTPREVRRMPACSASARP